MAAPNRPNRMRCQRPAPPVYQYLKQHQLRGEAWTRPSSGFSRSEPLPLIVPPLRPKISFSAARTPVCPLFDRNVTPRSTVTFPSSKPPGTGNNQPSAAADDPGVPELGPDRKLALATSVKRGKRGMYCLAIAPTRWAEIEGEVAHMWRRNLP